MNKVILCVIVQPAYLVLQQIVERTANRWANLDVKHPIAAA